MKTKILAMFLVVGIVILLFFIGLFTTELVMKKFVSHGKQVLVPRLIGINYFKAQELCFKNSLYIANVQSRYSSLYVKNAIIEQSPKDSIFVKKFRTVNVVVSKGAKLVKLPLLVGTSLSLGQDKLKNLGFKIGRITRHYNNGISKNLIVSTYPMAESEVPLGSRVDIDISLGSLGKKTSESIEYDDLF